MKQIVINFEDQGYPGFDSFLGSQNQELLSILKSDEPQLMLVWGAEGIGKSHLLKSWVKQRLVQGRPAIMISKLQQQNFDEILNNAYQYIAIDDIHKSDENLQIKLLHLFDELVNSGCHLLVSADGPPQRLTQLRHDLRTRLGLCLIYEIFPLSEQEKLETMRKFIQIRQTNISDEVLNYLISHSPRTLDFLLNTLQEVDNYAVKNKRKVTIPLLKQFLLEKHL
ncbi:MAG: DnaA regulatory inactivator Hda [Neisseriaceae bacterium]|nr:MAG: DnaA regulatory inactivator Hda [Neisseriaceae bacterium]